MAGSIKGIIVEIGGDTSGLQKALSKVNSATSSLSKELKGINSLLKLDPKNTELLAQKQTVLNQQISTTEDKLKQLQKIKEEADKKMAEGTEIDEANYRNLQREIINTQNKLSDLKNEASNWTKASENLTKFGDRLNSIGETVGNLGSKLTKTVTLPITALATAGVAYNAELEKYETSFTTFLGDQKQAAKVIEKIKKDSAKTPFDVTSLVQANQMLISTGENADDSQKAIMALGDAVTATGGGNAELTRMSANLQQIKNAGKATALDIKQFAYAGIDIYGILADYTGKTTAEVKEMDISYQDLTGALEKANSEGGKYYNAMNKSSETLTGQVNQLKSEVKDMTGDLTKSLMPVAKKVVDKAKDLIKKFDGLSDSQKENIVKIGLMVAAAGPLLKILGTATSTIGNVSKGIGTLTKAIGLMKNGIGDATGAAATLAKTMQTIGSTGGVVGIAIAAIVTAITVLITEIKKSEAEVRTSFENMGNAASDFYNEIQSAEGYLDRFNGTMFASSQEQEELSKQMEEIQNAITQICKTASEERRDYTQEEITQLDEYFNKLRELEEKELQIEQHRAEAITQSATTEAQAFSGSLAEYKELSTQWISTAQQQANKQIEIAERNRIDTIALLNSQYSEEERIDNEEYNRKVAQAETDYQLAVTSANKEVGDVSSIFAEGYSNRLNLEDETLETLKGKYAEFEKNKQEHNDKLEKIEEEGYQNGVSAYKRKQAEDIAYGAKQRILWDDMYKNMSEEQEKELGVWLAQLAQTELYGGYISEENQEMVDAILASYDNMPDETKKAMEDAMSPMLDEMEKSEPGLFAKASGIANGILSRLKKSFDIHSPSKETRDIFQNVMKGAELGLDDEQNRLNKQVDTIANQMKTNFANMLPNMGAIKQSVIDQTRTVFTTPSIIINAQDELTPAKINSIIDTVNRRLGSQY